MICWKYAASVNYFFESGLELEEVDREVGIGYLHATKYVDELGPAYMEKYAEDNYTGIAFLKQLPSIDWEH